MEKEIRKRISDILYLLIFLPKIVCANTLLAMLYLLAPIYIISFMYSGGHNFHNANEILKLAEACLLGVERK